MSACVSRHGEYSEHAIDDKHTCTRCLVLDEDALRADLDAVRKQLHDARDILRAAIKHGAAGPSSTNLLDVARWAADTIRAQYRRLIKAEQRDRAKPEQVTYRLPDWLGGHKVAEILRDTDAGVLVVVDTGAEQTRIAVPRSVLVEIKSPSIDDPSKWPLVIEEGGSTLTLRSPMLASVSRVAEIVVSSRDRLVAVGLTEGDLWEIAKTTAQFVKGYRRFDELHASERADRDQADHGTGA